MGGEVQFEPCYSNNPLVNALALGMARREELFFARARGVGNPVIYVGAKTGRDGIHGASLLASAEFSEESQQKRPNVQVGDPFMEKLLLEACLEAMGTGAVVAIQDMGAAGLTSSSAEMSSRGGVGIEIDLARVPQRETRHDAVRNHAERIAGAHAAGGRARAGARSFRGVREVGARRRGNRARDRGRDAARARITGGWRRKFRRTRWPKKGRGMSGPIAAAGGGGPAHGALVRFAARGRGPDGEFPAAARVAGDCVEVMDHRAVRFDGAHEHARRARRGRRGGAAAEGNEARAGARDGRQRAVGLS